MRTDEALELGIIIKNSGSFKYNGKCKECKHSQCYSYPASSNMCMNEKSEWHGIYHVDYSLGRFVNGCEKKEVEPC